MKAFGKIIKGKIVFDDRAKFLNDVAKFDDDIKIVIEVREAKDIRTNAQNRLWWKWIELIADETGNEKQEMIQWEEQFRIMNTQRNMMMEEKDRIIVAQG